MNFSSDPINTLENLIAKNKTKNISIYLVIISLLYRCKINSTKKQSLYYTIF